MKKISFFLAFLIVFTSVFVVVPQIEEVVHAIPATTAIKVGSFNIKNAGGGSQLDSIANQIRNYGLDVVGLQEVDRYTSRTPCDIMVELANRLGYYYAYFKTIDYSGGEYGIGTLSRWPITSTSAKELTYSKERRVLSRCVIKMSDSYSFNFYNTHIDASDEWTRRVSMSEVATTLKAPYFLTGDFNSSVSIQKEYFPEAEALSVCTSSYKMATYQSGSCIDNIYASASEYTLAEQGNVVNTISDHYMIWTTAYVKPTIFQGVLPSNLGDNVVLKIKNVQKGQMLSPSDDGLSVVYTDDVDSTTQYWRAVRHPNNMYTLINYSSKRALDIYNFGDANGTKVQTHTDNGSSAQKFFFYEINGKYYIKSIYCQKVLDINSSGECCLGKYTGGDDQAYTIASIGFKGKAPVNFGDEFTAHINNIWGKKNYVASGTDVIGSGATGDTSKWVFKRSAGNAYTIKNVSTGTYLYCAEPKTVGASVTLAEKGSKFRIYSLNNNFYIKPTSGSQVLDMDATNLDLNVGPYGTTDLQNSAQQVDIVWLDMDDYIIADIGESGEVYILNKGTSTFLSYDADNLINNTEKKKTLWKYQRNSDGSYSFIEKSSGLALQVKGSYHSIGTPLQLGEYTGKQAQKFFLYTKGSGGYYVRPYYTGKVLELTTDGYVKTDAFTRIKRKTFSFVDKSDNVLINIYTVKFGANGGSGAPADQTKTHGVTLTLPKTVPTKDGYTFLGWDTSKTATEATYKAGGSFKVNADTKLYAVWKLNTYAVKYDANGGSDAPADQTKNHGEALTLSEIAPTRAGYTFLGWAKSKTATEATYKAGAKLETDENTTLYAVWKQDKLTLKETSALVNNGGKLEGVNTGIVASELISNFEEGNIIVQDSLGNTVSDGFCGTGFKVCLVSDDAVVDSVTVIVKGDVDGDGEISSTDYLRIKNAFLNIFVLSEDYSIAADVDNDEVVTSTDYLKIKSYFLEG